MKILTFDTEEWYIEKHLREGEKKNIGSMTNCWIGF